MIGQCLACSGQRSPEGGAKLGSLPAKSFSDFFVHVLRYQFETCYIHLIGSATHWVRVSSQSGHSDILYRQKWVKVIFLHIWLQKLYRAFRFVTQTYVASVSTQFLSWLSWSCDRLIFNVGIPILVRRHLYIETAPWWTSAHRTDYSKVCCSK